MCGRIAKPIALSLLIMGTVAHAAPVHVPTVYYGITAHGGAFGFGSVFKIESQNRKTVETLYSFCHLGEGRCYDGERPNSLVMLPDGSLVGTTSRGGSGNAGVLFQLQPTDTSWRERTVISFCWYWQDCTHYGTPKGTLTYVGQRRGTPLLEGVIEDKKGRGLIYEADLGPPGFGDGVRVVRHLKRGL